MTSCISLLSIQKGLSKVGFQRKEISSKLGFIFVAGTPLSHHRFAVSHSIMLVFTSEALLACFHNENVNFKTSIHVTDSLDNTVF